MMVLSLLWWTEIHHAEYDLHLQGLVYITQTVSIYGSITYTYNHASNTHSVHVHCFFASQMIHMYYRLYIYSN